MSERGDEEQARAEILIDTDVLIEYFRGSPVVRRLIEEIRDGDIRAYFSTITETELYSGSRNEREDAWIAALLSFLTRADVDGNVAVVSGKLRYKYRARKLETPDAIIAGTAQILNVKLATFNKRHFEMIAEIELFGIE
ncbi:MAG: type II toxin-antitoxin system VapC family toxin [Anaerolineae bacterium]